MRALAFLALGVLGQSPDPPAFEVASVKLNKLDTRGFIGAVPGRTGFIGFKGTSARLVVLVEAAYNIADRQLSRTSGWVESEGFDVDARAEHPASEDQIRLMLQNLLADRFKLKIRWETKEEAVYDLVVEKDPPNLVIHPDDGTLPQISIGSKPTERVFQNMPISRLVRLVSGETGRTVIDRTGLAGSYDFKLEYVSSLAKGPREESLNDPGPSIFAAVRKLGLRLESRRGPSEYLTIEHAERPSAN